MLKGLGGLRRNDAFRRPLRRFAASFRSLPVSTRSLASSAPYSRRTSWRRCAIVLLALAPFALHAAPPQRFAPGEIETLKAVGGLDPAIVGRFREPLGFQQAENGDYFVFDRRGHAVYQVHADTGEVQAIVQIGGEEGRVLEPSAFGLHPAGTFAVADAPNRRERVQFFGFGGARLGGFTLPGRATTRISIGGLPLNGVGTLAFTGRTVILNEPETGSLITEYTRSGTPVRSIGALRPTGHEDDRELHLALNAAIPLVNPRGGYYVVFFAGTPMFRKYDPSGALEIERIMQGRELDPVIAEMPQRWPRRTVDGTEVPLVLPIVRAAAVDAAGRLWVAFTTPVTYVFDERGDKVRTVQFRGAGLISPTSLAFTPRGRLLVTPGCYEFVP